MVRMDAHVVDSYGVEANAISRFDLSRERGRQAVRVRFGWGMPTQMRPRHPARPGHVGLIQNLVAEFPSFSLWPPAGLKSWRPIAKGGFLVKFPLRGADDLPTFVIHHL